MSLIGQVGRRHWRVRLLMGTIYALLLVGSATMIYPFTLMLSTSVTSTAVRESAASAIARSRFFMSRVPV